MGAALTARIGFVSLRFVVLRRNVFIRWGICLSGLVPLLRSSIYFCLCVPRVSFRALPSFHPGLCRSIVPTALAIAEYTHSPKCLRVLTETSTAYLPKCLRVLTEVFTRTYVNEYDALTEVSTSYLLRPPDGLQKDKFHLFFCGALQNGVIARH